MLKYNMAWYGTTRTWYGTLYHMEESSFTYFHHLVSLHGPHVLVKKGKELLADNRTANFSHVIARQEA